MSKELDKTVETPVQSGDKAPAAPKRRASRNPKKKAVPAAAVSAAPAPGFDAPPVTVTSGFHEIPPSNPVSPRPEPNPMAYMPPGEPTHRIRREMPDLDRPYVETPPDLPPPLAPALDAQDKKKRDEGLSKLVASELGNPSDTPARPLKVMDGFPADNALMSGSSQESLLLSAHPTPLPMLTHEGRIRNVLGKIWNFPRLMFWAFHNAQQLSDQVAANQRGLQSLRFEYAGILDMQSKRIDGLKEELTRLIPDALIAKAAADINQLADDAVKAAMTKSLENLMANANEVYADWNRQKAELEKRLEEFRNDTKTFLPQWEAVAQKGYDAHVALIAGFPEMDKRIQELNELFSNFALLEARMKQQQKAPEMQAPAAQLAPVPATVLTPPEPAPQVAQLPPPPAAVPVTIPPVQAKAPLRESRFEEDYFGTEPGDMPPETPPQPQPALAFPIPSQQEGQSLAELEDVVNPPFMPGWFARHPFMVATVVAVMAFGVFDYTTEIPELTWKFVVQTFKGKSEKAKPNQGQVAEALRAKPAQEEARIAMPLTTDGAEELGTPIKPQASKKPPAEKRAEPKAQKLPDPPKETEQPKKPPARAKSKDEYKKMLGDWGAKVAEDRLELDENGLPVVEKPVIAPKVPKERIMPKTPVMPAPKVETVEKGKTCSYRGGVKVCYTDE